MHFVFEMIETTRIDSVLKSLRNVEGVFDAHRSIAGEGGRKERRRNAGAPRSTTERKGIDSREDRALAVEASGRQQARHGVERETKASRERRKTAPALGGAGAQVASGDQKESA